MKTVKTKYETDGTMEPCFEVTSDDGFVKVRIAPYYHYIGNDTLMVTQYLDGEYNSSDEIKGDFKSLTVKKVEKIALDMCVYLR